MFSNMPLDQKMKITIEQLEGSKDYNSGKLPRQNPYEIHVWDMYDQEHKINQKHLDWLSGWEEAYCYNLWQIQGDTWEKGTY